MSRRRTNLQEPDPVGQLVAVGGDGAHDDVGVAVHVFGQRVVADVGAELQRALWATEKIKITIKLLTVTIFVPS